MKVVYIQTNKFFANQVPTSQEDNHMGVFDRWDLFNDAEGKVKAGSMQLHNMGVYCVLHPNAIRYTFSSSDVGFM